MMRLLYETACAAAVVAGVYLILGAGPALVTAGILGLLGSMMWG